MSKIRYMLLLALCIFIAILGIGYVTVGNGGKDKTTQPQTGVTTSSQPVTQGGSAAGEEPSSDEAASQPTEPDTTAPTETTQEATETTEAQTTDRETESTYEYAYAGFNPSVAAVSDEKWYLLLVNQSYILPEDYTVKTAKVDGGSQSMDYRVAPHYDEMVAAAKADGISLIPVSGYRTYARQEANFNRKINLYTSQGLSKAQATRAAAKIVLMPGTSEHNAGLAMDFGTNGNTTLDENFGNTEAYKWLSANAADYGFIMRYPEDKQSITKVTYEPWHWRYVGVEDAKKIKASGLTLEEYLGMNA